MYRLKRFFALGLSLILCWTSFMGPVALYADDTPGIQEYPTQSISQEDSREDVDSASISEGDQNEIDSADTSTGAEDGDTLEVDEATSANDEIADDSSLEEDVSSALPENAESEAVDAWSLASSWRYQHGVLVSDQGSVSLYSMSTPPTGATMQGIDVSEFNGDIDWAKVKAAGIDFAILRLGYGEGYIDPKFVDNVHGCQENDIPFGVYVYCYAWDASSASREGQGAVQRLKQAGIDPSDLALPVYYDMENQDPTTGKPCGVNGNTRVEIQGGPQTFASMAESFASPLQSSGYSVGVYANLNWWNNYLTSSTFNKWDRWVAQYYSSCSYEGDYTIWQYTSSGSVPGISGYVDLNWWYGAPDTSGVKLSVQCGASTISAKASEFPLDPDNVAFCVYHDGIERWYQATRKTDGSWEADINALQDFKSFGNYSISLWATYGIATFEISSSTTVFTPGDVEASSSVLEGGALELSASGWVAAPTNVAFEVVAPSGASRWYAGAESGGAWRAEAAVFEDLGEVGVYAVRAWATIDGVTTVTAETSSELSAGEVSLSAEAEGGALRLSASGWALPARNVAFEVVAPSGASRWYQAERAGDGSWTASVAAGSDFGEWGEYSATAWATYGSSTKAYGSASASIKHVSIGYSVETPGGFSTTGSDGLQAHTWTGTRAEGFSSFSVEVLESPVDGYFTYQGYASGIGWSSMGSNGSITGTKGSSSCFSAIKVSAVGDLANYCDIWYRVYYGEFGWLGWTKNGSVAGTTNLPLRIEAIIMVALPKGGPAPGSTANSVLTSYPYIGFQNPSQYYQVSNSSVSIPHLGENIFGYRTESRIPYNATRLDCVNAMISRAYEYLGTPYVWDYSCAPGVGVDCAGLVMQCLYATGMDLSPMNPWDHYYQGLSGNWHAYYANYMWDQGRFKHVSLSERQRGDIISWQGHVAIYLGNDQIIEAAGSSVRVNNLWYLGTPRGVLRAFV